MNKIDNNQAEKFSTANDTTPKLSVIIPFRYDAALPHLFQRLEEVCRGFLDRNGLEIIAVDSGSDETGSRQAKEICSAAQVKYLFHDSRGQAFSIGEARDFAATYATGEAITFLDVDFRVSESFWHRLLAFMEIYGVPRKKKAFFTVPCLYLTQEGTKEFQSRCDDGRFNEALLHWLEGDKARIETLAPSSSIIVVNRLHYMSVGGHRPEFRGHGYEDMELIHRLLADEDRIPRSFDYYHDSKVWDSAEYRGFRSQFTLLGRPALLANLFAVHLWHPRPYSASFYGGAAMRKNREIWRDLFKEFDATKRHPQALVDSSFDTPALIIGTPKTNPMNCMRDAMPFFGPLIFMTENDFLDENALLDIKALETVIQQRSVNRIIFTNPYGNEARLQIYKWCRQTNFPYFCFDRGALPDSWFFDNAGFNADSAIYQREAWDHELTQDQIDATRSYIEDCLYSKESLEKQGNRIGGSALAQKLKVGGKRVLFVPLQRPSDTVIKYFSGKAQDFYEFVSFIDKAASHLKKLGWVVVCKKHPLETSAPSLEHAIYAHEDDHFLDLMEMADAVALINSGVGVYALMMGKPCFVFGQAFYSFEEINVRANIEDLHGFINSLIAGQKVNADIVYRFVHHLREHVYSFGKSKTIMRNESDGSMRNLTTDIDFYDLNLPGIGRWKFDHPIPRKIKMDAPLLERFHLDIQNRRKNQHASGSTHNHKKSKTRARVELLFHNPRAFAVALRGWIARRFG